MQNGQVDLVITGSDRTTYTGDVCNKIGTYLKALSAYDNKIPFYVALPSSTIDWNISDGNMIKIEERDVNEVHYVRGIDDKKNLRNIRVTPNESKASNYAFDVTPSKYITGLITEFGLLRSNESEILEIKEKIYEKLI
jgi:methylthioribose-1-phosphate isomerase